jgi:uncharacterized protein (TIGR00290 family)
MREMNSGMNKNAVVLWTGGKDSCLALYEAVSMGYKVKCLVTFAPEKERFLAHPLEFMKRQAESLNLPHRTIRVRPPFKEGYEKAIEGLSKTAGTLITGDISEVEGFPNWIRECSRKSGVAVLTPLWKRDRVEILRELIDLGFSVVFSCVKKPWFTMDWVGRTLDERLLKRLMKIRKKTGLDVCGENGEYHTLVVDGPLFGKPIQITSRIVRAEGKLMYMEIKRTKWKRVKFNHKAP